MVSISRFGDFGSIINGLAATHLLKLGLDAKVKTMKLTAVYEPASEGGYVCWLEEMPGVQSQGETMEEARANLMDAFGLSLEYLRDRAKREASPESVRENFEPSVA